MAALTRYEIAARHPDGRQYLIAYSPRLSRPGLLDAMRDRAEAIIKHCEMGEEDVMTFHTQPRVHVTLTNGWWIGFTGRTQLQSKSEGALAFVENFT